jgi:hypothetical protein
MDLGSTQPLTEMSTRNLPGDKGRPASKADNLTAICGPSRPVTGIALLYFTYLKLVLHLLLSHGDIFRNIVLVHSLSQKISNE